MPLRKAVLDNTIVNMLLDIYAEKTNLPVALYQFSSKEFIWSKKGIYSPLCLGINKSISYQPDKSCKENHIQRCITANAKMELCHAGLWNIALPIKVEGIVVGTLISGQRRLKDTNRSEESFNKFQKFQTGYNNKKRELFRQQYDDTPIIEQGDFDSHLLKSLISIQEYLYILVLNEKASEREKKNKIQRLAHEFLIPIQSIIAEAENLFNELTNNEQKMKSLFILEEMQKLAIIAENMRNSLTEQKNTPYMFSKRNIYKYLIESVNLFQSEANKKGVIIREPLAIDSKQFPRILISPENIARAISNLMHNAVKYSFSDKDSKRYIEILCRHIGNDYMIEISNFGVGILPDEISEGKIFEPGYRGILSADRHRTGSGIGLAEVKNIIEKHNGKITITSEGKGNAYKTVATVFLPIDHA